jgi:hypothetical protein
MIKFGIPSIETVKDDFPGQAVLTLNGIEKPNSKRKFTLSVTAAEQLGIQPGLSKVGFSFDGGNFIAAIPDSIGGIPNNSRLPVNKELSFISKVAHDYMCKKFDLDQTVDNHLLITSVEVNYEMKVGQFSTTPMVIETVSTATEVVPNDELL